eukprot:359258-Chlamydomonas_euryale.AAC.16
MHACVAAAAGSLGVWRACLVAGAPAEAQVHLERVGVGARWAAHAERRGRGLHGGRHAAARPHSELPAAGAG